MKDPQSVVLWHSVKSLCLFLLSFQLLLLKHLHHRPRVPPPLFSKVEKILVIIFLKDKDHKIFLLIYQIYISVKSRHNSYTINCFGIYLSIISLDFKKKKKLSSRIRDSIKVGLQDPFQLPSSLLLPIYKLKLMNQN